MWMYSELLRCTGARLWFNLTALRGNSVSVQTLEVPSGYKAFNMNGMGSIRVTVYMHVYVILD